MEGEAIFLNEKNEPKFCCEKCDYYTNKNKDFLKHLETIKHKTGGKATKCYTKIPISCEICYKTFKHHSSMYRHKKNCDYKKGDINTCVVEDEKVQTLHELLSIENFMELMKQNNEFKDLILEQNKIIADLAKNSNNTVNNINNTINNNSNNKTFNLNMFLNEKCKDALNIDEFVDSLKISLADLENLGENGFVNGVSRIFVNGLKNLDVYKRPIHCSDLKRETMYLKELNVWEKDNENKDKLRKVVKMISHKNMLKVKDWKEAYPQYNDLESKKNDQYLKILIGAAGPYNKEEEEQCYAKIVKNIAKEVIIDKNST